METPVQVKLHLVLRTEPDGKTMKIRILSIAEINDPITYAFPYEYQEIEQHPELGKLQTVKRTCSSLKKRNQFRNIKISLPPDIVPLYMDSDRNFIFRDYTLEEVQMDKSEELGNESMSEFKQFINGLQQKTIDSGSMTRSFVLEVFKGKSQNAEYWMRNFESECDRHGILSDEKKIEALRLFLAENGEEWFSAAHVKLSSVGTWLSYRESFLQTFSDEGWINVRMAFGYKFLGGSLLEYALRKEKLLLEVDPEMSIKTRIYLIVVGLPIYVQDRIDKGEINSTENLMSHLRKLESLVNKKNQKATVKTVTSNPIVSSVEKKPCFICERLGKPGRYHPTELCRNKIRHNQIELVNNLEMEERLNLAIPEQKN